jgi:hypothetical protein
MYRNGYWFAGEYSTTSKNMRQPIRTTDTQEYVWLIEPSTAIQLQASIITTTQSRPDEPGSSSLAPLRILIPLHLDIHFHLVKDR